MDVCVGLSAVPIVFRRRVANVAVEAALRAVCGHGTVGLLESPAGREKEVYLLTPPRNTCVVLLRITASTAHARVISA